MTTLDHGFTPEEFAHVASLLRSGHEAIVKAALSNNYNVILAALDALSSLPAQAVGVKPLDTRAQAIWDAVEARIDAAPIDGISAEGQYSETVFNGQRLYVDGLRAGRLAAINALAPSQPAAVGVTDERVDRAARALSVWKIKPGMAGYRMAARDMLEAALRSTP